MTACGLRRLIYWPRLAPRRAICSALRFGCSPPSSMLSTRPKGPVTLPMMWTPKYPLLARAFGQLGHVDAGGRLPTGPVLLKSCAGYRSVGRSSRPPRGFAAHDRVEVVAPAGDLAFYALEHRNVAIGIGSSCADGTAPRKF